EAGSVGFYRPLDLGLAAPELGDAISLAGPMRQLGEPLQRRRGRGLEPEPFFEGSDLPRCVAPLTAEPRPHRLRLARIEMLRSEVPHRLQGLVGPAGPARPVEPGPPDRRIGAGVPAATQPALRLVPSAILDGQARLPEPDAVALRPQLAGSPQ